MSRDEANHAGPGAISRPAGARAARRAVDVRPIREHRDEAWVASKSKGVRRFENC